MSTRDIGRCITGPSRGGMLRERIDPWNGATGRGLRVDDIIVVSPQARIGRRCRRALSRAGSVVRARLRGRLDGLRLAARER